MKRTRLADENDPVTRSPSTNASRKFQKVPLHDSALRDAMHRCSEKSPSLEPQTLEEETIANSFRAVASAPGAAAGIADLSEAVVYVSDSEVEDQDLALRFVEEKKPKPLMLAKPLTKTTPPQPMKASTSLGRSPSSVLMPPPKVALRTPKRRVHPGMKNTPKSLPVAPPPPLSKKSAKRVLTGWKDIDDTWDGVSDLGGARRQSSLDGFFKPKNVSTPGSSKGKLTPQQSKAFNIALQQTKRMSQNFYEVQSRIKEQEASMMEQNTNSKNPESGAERKEDSKLADIDYVVICDSSPETDELETCRLATSDDEDNETPLESKKDADENWESLELPDVTFLDTIIRPSVERSGCLRPRLPSSDGSDPAFPSSPTSKHVEKKASQARTTLSQSQSVQINGLLSSRPSHSTDDAPSSLSFPDDPGSSIADWSLPKDFDEAELNGDEPLSENDESLIFDFSH